VLPIKVGGGATCARAYSSLKLSLHLMNAVRMGLPCPSLGAVPTPMSC
jgi:hypothetical protein